MELKIYIEGEGYARKSQSHDFPKSFCDVKMAFALRERKCYSCPIPNGVNAIALTRNTPSLFSLFVYSRKTKTEVRNEI